MPRGQRDNLAHNLAPPRDAREIALAHAVRDAHGLGGDVERATHDAPRAAARAQQQFAPVVLEDLLCLWQAEAPPHTRRHPQVLPRATH